MEDVLLSETTEQINKAENNKQEKTYLFEPGTFKPLAFVQNKNIYHYHLDHLGTPQEISDAEGNIVWAVSFKAYGNLAVAYENEIENNIRFQGQYFDEETGLHYNRFRYYDPTCGQFINQDPIGLMGGNNNYLYVPNPTGWVDPYGLACKEVIPENYDPLTDTYKGVDLNLFSPNEVIHFSAKKVKNNPDIFVVGGHGNPKTMVDLNRNEVKAENLAKIIENHPKYRQGMPVYLLSCNTGKGVNCYAQHVSNILKSPVKAPDKLLWYWKDGTVAPYDKKIINGKDLPDTSKPGKINTFNPMNI